MADKVFPCSSSFGKDEVFQQKGKRKFKAVDRQNDAIFAESSLCKTKYPTTEKGKTSSSSASISYLEVADNGFILSLEDLVKVPQIKKKKKQGWGQGNSDPHIMI